MSTPDQVSQDGRKGCTSLHSVLSGVAALVLGRATRFRAVRAGNAGDARPLLGDVTSAQARRCGAPGGRFIGRCCQGASGEPSQGSCGRLKTQLARGPLRSSAAFSTGRAARRRAAVAGSSSIAIGRGGMARWKRLNWLNDRAAPFRLAVLASPFRSKLRLEAEKAMLRYQLNVVRRGVGAWSRPAHEQ